MARDHLCVQADVVRRGGVAVVADAGRAAGGECDAVAKDRGRDAARRQRVSHRHLENETLQISLNKSVSISPTVASSPESLAPSSAAVFDQLTSSTR